MAARWSELLLRVYGAMDDADRDLSDTDRRYFYVHLIAAGIRRRERRSNTITRHPLPNAEPLYTRDPSGG